MTSFERLHPSLRHHIVNTLEWRSLRPLQDAAIDPILDGEHGLLLAPTAGGKTEAASFPVISRIATERWQPISVLYLAPLRALLNNLEPRLTQYTAFTGHRADVWHGDVSQSSRSRILGDPPDILATTPESLEAMLISTRVDPRRFFRNLRTAVIDEVHSFASDDRGWHLLAVLQRLGHLAGNEIQRLGLSATVGNPEELLTWLTAGSVHPRRVIAPRADAVVDDVDVEVDWVGSIANAGQVVSRLHQGEKRLVFVDSRARAENLTSELRANGTNTFLSHGSLSRDERHRTEQAFVEAQNCVIVATSTLELGIDIGDLDRVIQIDSPSTVASFLQRLGRTGRRAGSTRNALFLGTRDEAFLQSLGLLRLWSSGYVEPVTPPPLPAHLLAQQIMALTLQEGALGRSAWRDWLGRPPALGTDVAAFGEEIVTFMVDQGVLFDDQELLSFGDAGEATFGRRHFMDLMSAFTAEPVFAVRSGRTEIGLVPDIALSAAETNQGVLLLAGRHWKIESVDWHRRVINVLPVPGGGKIQFWGSAQPLGFELCQSMKAVLQGDQVGVRLSKRAAAKRSELEVSSNLVGNASDGARLVHDNRGVSRWFTFAGLRANLELSARLRLQGVQHKTVDNLSISFEDGGVSGGRLTEICRGLPADQQACEPSDEMIDGLKFHEALPHDLATRVVQLRLADPQAVAKLLEAL